MPTKRPVIVRTTYHRKRPPNRRIPVPYADRQSENTEETRQRSISIEAEPAALPERPRIVTAHATTRFGPVQDIDAKEHERRGHAAEALRDPVRRATGDGGVSRNATGAAMGMTHCRPAPRRGTTVRRVQDATAVERTVVETYLTSGICYSAIS